MRNKPLLILTALVIFYAGSVLWPAYNFSDTTAKAPRKTMYYNSAYYNYDDEWALTQNGYCGYRQYKSMRYDLWGVMTDFFNTSPASPRVGNFGVSAPVKNGNTVEVTFRGSMHGNAGCYIICLEEGSAATVLTRSAFYSTWETSSHYYTREDIVWAPFTLKATFRANQNGTLRFRIRLWQENWYGNNVYNQGGYKCVWLNDLLATAEIIN